MPISKQDLRQQLRSLRNAIPATEQSKAAQQLRDKVCELPEYINAKHIALYWPHDAEIDCIPLLNAALEHNKHCFLPVLWLKNRQTLAFAAYTSLTPMLKNRYGILEPDVSYTPLIELGELDIVFVPLVGFDVNGWRLGRGGGFYDATFADLQREQPKKRPKIVGLAYECQCVAEIPIDSWDWQLDAVVTECRSYVFAKHKL